MNDWIPVLVFPNVDMRGTIECEFAAIAPVTDARIERLRSDHPRLTTFLSKFSDQFGEDVWPSVFILHANAPQSYYTAEAVTGFRDVLSLSVIPFARASRLRFNSPNSRIFTDMFKFYPWMIDSAFEEVVLINPAQRHIHDLSLFSGQSYPEQSQSSVLETHIDLPLAKCLLEKWIVRYADGVALWKDRALFRSLNMANDAGSLPSPTATTFYDVGRSLALWVSAYEILVHPGGTGLSNFKKVVEILEKVRWIDGRLAAQTHSIPFSKPAQGQIASKICKLIYGLRDDFLHGNDVDQSSLLLNGLPITDFAACLYRLALTGYLDLFYSERPLLEQNGSVDRTVFGEQF